jgi:hypothetical protein
LFEIVSWVTTLGYWRMPYLGHPNNGAVLMVAPILPTAIKPFPDAISTFNSRPVPPLEVACTGYPCGEGKVGQSGGIVCSPDYRKRDRPGCTDVLGQFQPLVCEQKSGSFIKECCACNFVRPVAGFCKEFAPFYDVRRYWQSQGPVLPVTGMTGISYFPPANSGQVLTYLSPGCSGDIGAPLINKNANSIFAVMIGTTEKCDKNVGTLVAVGL